MSLTPHLNPRSFPSPPFFPISAFRSQPPAPLPPSLSFTLSNSRLLLPPDTVAGPENHLHRTPFFLPTSLPSHLSLSHFPLFSSLSLSLSQPLLPTVPELRRRRRRPPPKPPVHLSLSISLFLSLSSALSLPPLSVFFLSSFLSISLTSSLSHSSQPRETPPPTHTSLSFISFLHSLVFSLSLSSFLHSMDQRGPTISAFQFSSHHSLHPSIGLDFWAFELGFAHLGIFFRTKGKWILMFTIYACLFIKFHRLMLSLATLLGQLIME